MALTKVIGSGVEGISNSSDATAITIDSSEKVGIGETSPQGILHIKSADAGTTADGGADELVIEGSGNSGITIASGASSSGSIYFADSGSAYAGWINYAHSSNTLNLATDGGTRITINSEGVTQVNASQAAYALQVTNDGDNTNRFGIQITCGADNGAGTNYLMGFRDGDGGSVGSITYSSTTTSFNTSSDYRLKSNIADLTDATTKLKELKPKKFSWTKDTTNTLLHGFLAHEVSSVVPEAVIGEKDAKDADGNPEYQQIDHSKLIPLLVKTIQELEARIATLEAK